MPAVAIEVALRPRTSDLLVDAERWGDDATFVAVDREVAGTETDAISVRGTESVVEQVAIEVMTRCQRFVDRRNAASATRLWDDARAAHEALHDCSMPLVLADLEHAVDTWQWVLRLEPDASLAVQLAALFHDVERLESEAERRVEQLAPDYVAFKTKHAQRGGQLAEHVLRMVGAEPETAARVRDIVAAHEERGRDDEVDLLNDADGLSFFSLNSPGYADYFGPDQTRKKVAYTFARLGPSARRRLTRTVRLREDVRAHLAAVVGA